MQAEDTAQVKVNVASHMQKGGTPYMQKGGTPHMQKGGTPHMQKGGTPHMQKGGLLTCRRGDSSHAGGGSSTDGSTDNSADDSAHGSAHPPLHAHALLRGHRVMAEWAKQCTSVAPLHPHTPSVACRIIK
ncbi:hypothetical protein PVPAM_120033400 [Plasmodium vivax]|nr:hypothetical protein PVPAM_120033400 [Plasmodium vivax]